MIYNIC